MHAHTQTHTHLMIPGGHAYAVGEDESIGTVEQGHVPPANDDPGLLAQQEGVEAQVIDTKVQPPLPRKPVVPVAVGGR